MASNENITTRRPCEFIYLLFLDAFLCVSIEKYTHMHTGARTHPTQSMSEIQNHCGVCLCVWRERDHPIAAYFHILFSTSSSSSLSTSSSSSMKCVLKARHSHISLLHAINYYCWSRESPWKSDHSFSCLLISIVPPPFGNMLKCFEWAVRNKICGDCERWQCSRKHGLVLIHCSRIGR